MKKFNSELDYKLISTGGYNNKFVWIFDLRYTDFNKKPIRKVLPQRVFVRSNEETKKKIYYSSSHFVRLNKHGDPVSSKIIALFDNTGYRSYTGNPLRIFNDEHECKMAFQATCNNLAKEFEKWVAVIDEKHQKLRTSFLNFYGVE